jgi:hypothetical protein
MKALHAARTSRATLLVATVFLAASAAAVGADGGGGMTLGYYVGSHPLIVRYNLPASGGDLMYFGGYGYGVTSRGLINGGFGVAVLDTQESSGVAGGMGGFITGFRLVRVPLHIALVSWTGVGGLYTGHTGPNAERGYFVGFEEVALEVGVPVASWFMPTLYVGYQLTANLIPGLPLRENVTYAPVAGIRLTWGRFR